MINNSNLYSNIERRMNSKEETSGFSHNEEEEERVIADINSYNKIVKHAYMKSLLNPEAHLAKIPSVIPCESAVAPLRYNFNITPNASGNFALIIDPFSATGYLYQDSTTNGTGSGVVTNLTFAQDVNVIDQWRLVSSTLILKYFGNFNQLSGFFVSATTSNLTAATQTSYLTFSNVELLTNKQVLKCIDGVKLIYTPLDENSNEYASNTSYSGGTHPCRWQYLFVVVGSAFPNTACIRADYFRNVEYTSTPAFKVYIPQTQELPQQPYMPNIKQTVTPAPIDFRGGGIVQLPSSSGIFGNIVKDIADGAINIGKEMFQDYLPIGKGMKNVLRYGFK